MKTGWVFNGNHNEFPNCSLRAIPIPRWQGARRDKVAYFSGVINHSLQMKPRSKIVLNIEEQDVRILFI